MGKLTSLREVIMSKSLGCTLFGVLTFTFAPLSVYAHSTGLYDSRNFSNAPSVKHSSRTYELIDSKPIYADRAELVEYVHCHDSPMVGHYQESTTEAVGTVAGAALGHEFSGGSFKPFGTLLGAFIGNKIGEKVSPPKKVMPGTYTHCGKAYRNQVVNTIVGYRKFYRTDNGIIKIIDTFHK